MISSSTCFYVSGGSVSQFPLRNALALGGGGKGGKLWCWAGGEVNCGAGRGGTTRKTQNS